MPNKPFWIKELEQQLKSVHEVHSSADVKDLESQLAQKRPLTLVLFAGGGGMKGISGERLSENEGLRAQLTFVQKESDAIRKLLPTVVERLLQSHEYKTESSTYPYVDRISHLSEKPVQDLLKTSICPCPLGMRQRVVSPERSKTGPSLQDPASKHASGGSKAPPSKKT
ncbi:hypothetical protein Tco_0568641 [Tanacetum coccineum]